MIGRRIVIDGIAIERAVDFTTAVAVAGGVRFVVLMDAARLWTGKRRHTFTVLGSTMVPLHGRLVLPELLLEPIEACAS